VAAEDNKKTAVEEEIVEDVVDVDVDDDDDANQEKRRLNRTGPCSRGGMLLLGGE
jgi:hypothetical protein